MMKERSREKMAELLMEELFSQLSERGSIRKMLGEMTGLPISALIKNLVTEFELVVEKYHRQSFDRSVAEKLETIAQSAEPYTPESSPATPLPVVNEPILRDPPAVTPTQLPPSEFSLLSEEFPTVPEKSDERVSLDDVEKNQVRSIISSTEEPTSKESHTESLAELKEADREQSTESPKEVSGFRKRLEELARKVENEYLQQLEKDREPKRESLQTPVPSEPRKEPPRKELDELEPPVVHHVSERDVHATKGKLSRVPYRLDDRDCVYVHGAMHIPPDESPIDEPFMLEEKGIDTREFAFALDIGGLRLFLSKVNQNELSVSRKGVLLLGKTESIQLRGLHEGILNELRAHGLVLPMEFGTVARGRDDLVNLIKRYNDDLESSLEKLAKTRWWTLSLSVLDGRIAHLFANESDTKQERVGRERERMSYSPPQQQKKLDVKVLEKVLQKEKRLAESVHRDLSALTDRSEVQSMVGLGSGSSDEWKSILKSSYFFPGNEVKKLTRAVIDLQYRHILFEPMLSVTGDKDYFSFLKR